MPERYNCVNIGIDGYPVWLTLTDKLTIVVIEPARYLETSTYQTPQQVILKTVVTVVAKGCAIEVKTPASVENVCAVLGFTYQGDVATEVAQPTPPEAQRTQAAPPEAEPERGE